MKQVKALSLFSGGLDSILAHRVVSDQGIDVVAVKFVTPFFGNEILLDIPGYQKSIKEKYDIEVIVVDISEGYLDLLKNPAHGFGKNFNPCVDCKILMLSRAKELMTELEASFLITGEVLGQRPMSQRRDTLNVIARDTDAKSILLRPLCAKLMNPTVAEEEGLVDREKLYDFSGRGRSRQIALAKALDITDFPSPGGGCILADPILSKRIRKVYENDFVVSLDDITAKDITLMLIGRQFRLPGGGWLILGRDLKENIRLNKYIGPEDARFRMEDRPGPVGVLRRARDWYESEQIKRADIEIAASLVVRYGRKIDGQWPDAEVTVWQNKEKEIMSASVLADDQFMEWVL